MNIDLSQFHDERVSSISIRGEIEETRIDFNGREIQILEPIEYEGEIYRIDGEKLLHLYISYRYREACGRCLDSFIKGDSVGIEARLDEEVRAVADGEDDTIYYMDDKLNLRDHIIDAIILSLPMKPLCGENCKGLCPSCGVNHNTMECDCITDDIDPRFEKLKDFFPDK
ncbi:MAG: DUF177 domain-containing protein [Tissierellia bacterium]|nr:DUF177 domain-containing protein [Tissierellia bacterium]